MDTIRQELRRLWMFARAIAKTFGFWIGAGLQALAWAAERWPETIPAELPWSWKIAVGVLSFAVASYEVFRREVSGKRLECRLLRVESAIELYPVAEERDRQRPQLVIVVDLEFNNGYHDDVRVFRPDTRVLEGLRGRPLFHHDRQEFRASPPTQNPPPPLPTKLTVGAANSQRLEYIVVVRNSDWTHPSELSGKRLYVVVRLKTLPDGPISFKRRLRPRLVGPPSPTAPEPPPP